MTPAVWIALASFVGSLMGTAVIAGISYGKVSSTLAAHGKWLEQHEEKLDQHDRDLASVKTKLSFLKG